MSIAALAPVSLPDPQVAAGDHGEDRRATALPIEAMAAEVEEHGEDRAAMPR